jgi:hypothetical protein
MIGESTQLKRYKALSSVGEALLPRAEKMHREGMPWRYIARELRVSYTALHIWRKLAEESFVEPAM